MCFTHVNPPLPNLNPSWVATLIADTDTVEDLIEEERLRREEEEEMLRRDEFDTENVS